MYINTVNTPLAEGFRSFTSKDNVRVSARSLFREERWDFTAEIGNVSLSASEKVINWRFQVTPERDFLDPAYEVMLLALKQLAYTMLFLDKPRKCLTVIHTFKYMRRFVRFLSEREHPIYRFSDVLESDLERYIDQLRVRVDLSGEVTAGTLCLNLVELNRLFDFRDYLVDSLRYKPTKNSTPRGMAGVQNSRSSKTQAIPDDELKAIIDLAVDYIQNRAPLMFKCLRDYKRFARTVNFVALKGRGVKARYIESHFFLKRKDYCSASELNTSLLHLRTACLILILFCTGMRISEALAIKRNCIRQQLDQNHGTFYWIHSLLFKTQKSNSGSPRSWMCGRLAAQAVSVLEQMGDVLDAGIKTPYLLFAYTHFLIDRATSTKKIKPLSMGLADDNLRRFGAANGINIVLHAHRFRKSFARNIVRYSTTPILALKDHFKHWSLYMTDWYIGLDDGLIEELEAERLLLSIETMDKICTQPVSGAGGRRWSQELERRIAEGRLPRNFRGKAGAEFRKDMIQDFHISGIVVTKCGAFTNCIFEASSALCTKGNRPLVNLCNPYDCTNSYILPENIAFHKEKLTTVERLYDKLSKEEKNGPVGVFYFREIQKIRRGLETVNVEEYREDGQ